MQIRLHRMGRAVPHVIAAGLALFYAWGLSQTSLRTTGLQFVSPLIVIILVHLGWTGLRHGLPAGFAAPLLGRACLTALGIMVALVLGGVFAPSPAHADVGDVFGTILIVVICAAMVAIVIGLAALALYVVIKFVAWLFGRGKSGPQSRLFDFGSIGACCAVLVVASVEGMPGGFAFSKTQAAGSTYVIDRPPDVVWAVMQTATSPDFPLPGLLATLPRPVAVTTDEGVGLGANRVVRFEGREGVGRLHLQVTERTPTMARFDVVSDTTPYAGWIGYDRLTYQVEPAGASTRLSVTLDFERKLAPAWFFGPVMRRASYLAADVLARDVVMRAAGYD